MRRSLRIPVAPALALTVGALWWWAVLRLVLAPAEAGTVEGAVAVGGWGLGLLPVHCVPGPVRKARRAAAVAAAVAVAGATRMNGVAGMASAAQAARAGAAGAGGGDGGATTASRLRRSGEGSGPS
ncbi:hypothetical protein [Streptomyces antarcticus]|uniref:hypothetical protein n=1 Tax=Streptomyces antarcticus TaxID=2996458 RepID=UPI0022B02E86|nr:hypothetical protein [Streptomyces sp. H34-S5]MCZ4085793.1 hypothetical protein [Streptomyces sp. H34-S5]